MAKPPDDAPPRDFRLSRGPSDLWVLPAALAFGAALVFAPDAVPWIIRAALAGVAVLLLCDIPSARRLARAEGPAPPARGDGAAGTWVALGVLGFWVWYIARGFLAGAWIDAGLAAVLVAELTYLEWLRSRRGGRGRGR